MIVSRITDWLVVKEFMTTPEIFETIAEDGMTPEAYMPDTVNRAYLGVWNDEGALIAIYTFHELNSITLICHAQVLKRYRKKYSKLAGEAIYDWFLNKCPEQYQKLQTPVPEIYPNVCAYLEYFGFKNEGVSRKSIKKNGKILNSINYGITREEVAKWKR